MPKQSKRLSGILVHPTSFPSPYGIGDLGEAAYKFVDFLHKSKQTLWQVLPLGPTSFGDSPYQSFSTFAGNPLLISPDLLLQEGYLTEGDLTSVPNFDATSVDYGTVIEYKETLFKKAFAGFKKNADEIQKASYEAFCKKNEAWLADFTLFIALKNHYISERRGTFETPEYKAYKAANEAKLSIDSINDNFYGGSWASFEEGVKKRDKKAMKDWTKKLADEIEYYSFLQYEFFRQWVVLKDYANSLGIHVVGDIPIFVAMDSADVWANTELFCFDSDGYPTVVAGVPPDYFSVTGQLWGNPLYNWSAHKKSGYKWWINRISATLSAYDILRIDHFRGFDEYWAVPYGNPTAELGEWLKGPRHDLFKAIKDALGELPIIAEDLGLMTDTVIELRDTLGFPGMKILQFAWSDDKLNDYLPHNYDTNNFVVYTGTHDNDTTVSWYEKATDYERDHLRRYLNVSGENVAWDLIRLAMACAADYAVIPIQDIMSLGGDARMNTPGVASGNWRFRYTEDMLKEGHAEGLAYFSELFDRNGSYFEDDEEVNE